MSADDFSNDLRELEEKISGFLTPLRAFGNLDADAADSLFAVLEDLNGSWLESEMLPKRIPFLLHELMIGIESVLQSSGPIPAGDLGEVLLRCDELITRLYSS